MFLGSVKALVTMCERFDIKRKSLMQPYATKQFYLKQPYATIQTVINNYLAVLLLSWSALIIFGILYVLETVGHKSAGKEETQHTLLHLFELS